jgi:hypothetical protein
MSHFSDANFGPQKPIFIASLQSVKDNQLDYCLLLQHPYSHWTDLCVQMSRSNTTNENRFYYHWSTTELFTAVNLPDKMLITISIMCKLFTAVGGIQKENLAVEFILQKRAFTNYVTFSQR